MMKGCSHNMLLMVENLCLSYDKKVIFNNASFRVLPNEKIGIVGNNGVGKTTLVNVLCGNVIPDSGSITFDKSIRVGYLDQYMHVDGKISIDTYLKGAFLPLYQKESEMNAMLDELCTETDMVKINRYVRLTTQMREELESKDFYAIDSKIGRIVSGLGIVKYGMHTLISHLSGGQKMKVILAKLLLEEPDLLILDEPTNFLDTSHVEWLVKYLKEYKGNFLIVSHNQEFLNDVVNVVVELEFGKITKYKGNYQEYIKKKMMLDADYEKRYLSQQREIKELRNYIEKNKVKTSTARQAQSRIKKLEKIEVLDKPKTNDIHINLTFNYQPIHSSRFLIVDQLEIGYDRSLLPPISFEIRSGVKLAITGFNGIGKTTLLKTLVGELKPLAGKFHFVDNAKIAYFEQEHHFDNPNLTPLEEIQLLYPKMDNVTVRSCLAKCGITGNLAISPIKKLSGGEQSKVKLCKIMLQKANVLILDEPTNHLDKLAKVGLLEALKKYEGTIIFVSHETDFIQQLSTQVYSIEDLLIQ